METITETITETPTTPHDAPPPPFQMGVPGGIKNLSPGHPFYTTYFNLWVCPVHSTAYVGYSGDTNGPNAAPSPAMCCQPKARDALVGLHGEEKHAEIRRWRNLPKVAGKIQVEGKRTSIHVGSPRAFTDTVPNFAALAGNFFDGAGQQGQLPLNIEVCLREWLQMPE